MEQNLKYELFTQYNNDKNKENYKRFIDKFLSSKNFYILVNEDTEIIGLNPMIIPIKDTDWMTICLFETKEIAEQYIDNNGLENYASMEILNKDVFLMTVEQLFYKGVTGILYMGTYINDIKTIYIPIFLIGEMINNKLFTSNNIKIIKVLNNVLLNKKYLHYVYHQTLTVDEIMYGIVRFKEEKSKKKTINLFVDRNSAENYCEKNKIYLNKLKMILNQAKLKPKKNNKEILSEIDSDKLKDMYPTTTIKNDLLFHSISLLKKRKLISINTIKIHDLNEVYNISLDDFISLIMRIGFPQIDLT